MSTHKNEKNIALAPELLAEVEKLASSDNRTTDDLANEAVQKYLKTRGTITELRSFVARNREEATKRGLTERDVIPKIKEYRKEKRER
jgi:predicted transcriptional regulator